MRNLYLVQVVDAYGPNKFLPLAVSYLWVFAKTSPLVSRNWQVCDVLIEKQPIDAWVSTLDCPDIVALSSYVWNWQYNQSLAMAIKAKYPNCLIVVGGPQVSKYDAKFFDHYPFFDLAILGEGELAFQKILEQYETGNFHDIPHVFVKGSFICDKPTRIQNINDIPSPILTGFYDWIISNYQEKNPGNYFWQVTYETMRGCPYQCAFCDIGDSYWNKLKFFDIERVRDEITWMGHKHIEYVSLCDSNWGITQRDYDITRHVIETRLSTGFPKVWDATWAKNNPARVYEIAKLDHEHNTRLFRGITFSLQSLNDRTLSATKRFNLQNSEVYEYMARYQQLDIPTYSELIWPMPYETLDSFKQGLKQLIAAGQKDFLMVHPLVLTPNSPMGQPEYIKQHQLTYCRVPLDTFWLRVEDPETYVTEYVDAVCSTSTVTMEETITGHLVAHWLIVLFYYGWAHAIMEYLDRFVKINQIDFVDSWITYFAARPHTMIGREHTLTEQSLRSVFLQSEFWGRRVMGKDDELWEYKSATCVVIHKNRERFVSELETFIQDVYGIDMTDFIKFNMDLCVDWRSRYPLFRHYQNSRVLEYLGINNGNVIIDHWDQQSHNESSFVHTAYHYKRKNRYWRCSVTPVE